MQLALHEALGSGAKTAQMRLRILNFDFFLGIPMVITRRFSGICWRFGYIRHRGCYGERLMLNEPKLMLGLTSEEPAPASCHSEIPEASQTPLPSRAVTISGLADAKTTPPLPANYKPNPGRIPQPTRKTKIIITLGPATENGDVLRNLLEAGVSVFRIKLSCISRESALKSIYTIRSISTQLQRPVAMLLEIQTFAERDPNSPTVCERDWADIRFGLEAGVDWLALATDGDGKRVGQVRQFLAEQKKTNIGILVRIESPPTPAALDQMIQGTDGVILDGIAPDSGGPGTKALPDWGLIAQKFVSARKLAVIVIGTNLNLAAALSAQPDALLFAGETGFGANPLQSVQTLDEMIRREEAAELREATVDIAMTTNQDLAVATAIRHANEAKLRAIVILTRSGNSAYLCASLRPRQARLFVFTPDVRLARSLRLRYALEPTVLTFSAQPKATVSTAERVLRSWNIVPSGTMFVLIADGIDQRERTCLVQVRELP